MLYLSAVRRLPLACPVNTAHRDFAQCDRLPLNPFTVTGLQPWYRTLPCPTRAARAPLQCGTTLRYFTTLRGMATTLPSSRNATAGHGGFFSEYRPAVSLLLGSLHAVSSLSFPAHDGLVLHCTALPVRSQVYADSNCQPFAMAGPRLIGWNVRGPNSGDPVVCSGNTRMRMTISQCPSR